MSVALFGGFDDYFQILIILMIADYVTGVLTALYKKEFHSNIGYKGIIKKVGMLICITVSKQMDSLNLYDGEVCVRSVILLFFSINEILSILENMSKIGITMPNSFTKMIKKKKIK